MRNTLGQLLYWTPRIVAILFALFISLFAFDVFDAGFSAGEVIVALVLHLVPTALVVIALLIAWRRDLAGAILFAALGIAYIIVFWDPFEWQAYLFIPGPLFLIAALFLAGGLYRNQRQPAP